ncbi:putative inner membrane protein [Pseudomonas aeruginosa]|nr:putative inner membrane protein [Pseudomonas aeruginosa]
MGLWKVCR